MSNNQTVQPQEEMTAKKPAGQKMTLTELLEQGKTKGTLTSSEIMSVIEKDGKLNNYAGKFSGMDAFGARDAIVEAKCSKAIAFGHFLLYTLRYASFTVIVLRLE